MNQEHPRNGTESVVSIRKLLIRRMRADVQLVLAQYRAARRKMSFDTRASLRRRRAEITASVGNVRYERRLMVDRMGRNVAGAALACHGNTTATQSWPDRGSIRPSNHCAHDSPELNVLHTIRAHPEGIRLVEMGNEVGVDWRHLVPAVYVLTDAGRIEQLDDLFYPAG